MALCVDCSPARLLYASFQEISLRTKAPAGCRGAAPPLLAQMLAPRAFAAGEGDTGESCASPPPPSLRSFRAWPARALWDTESFPSLSLSVCVCSPATARSCCLLGCWQWQSYAATVLAAAYLNLKG